MFWAKNSPLALFFLLQEGFEMVSTRRKSSCELILPQNILIARWYAALQRRILSFLQISRFDWKIHDNIKRHLYCIFKLCFLQNKMLRVVVLWWCHNSFARWEKYIFFVSIKHCEYTLRVTRHSYTSAKARASHQNPDLCKPINIRIFVNAFITFRKLKMFT